MAARRGKTQARRNAGNNGMPGWAWAIIGALIAVVVVLAWPKLRDTENGDLLGPRPNPDAQPAPPRDAGEQLPAPQAPDPAEQDDEPDYDFYTLLPGKEVPISDAELAAQQRVEAQEAERAAEAAARALPKPVDSADDTAVAPTPAPPPATTRDDGSYLLQAGAFGAPDQAEALKAKIALLGLGARVESATIQGKAVHRVRMGPYNSASELAEAKRKLASGGLPGLAIKVK